MFSLLKSCSSKSKLLFSSLTSAQNYYFANIGHQNVTSGKDRPVKKAAIVLSGCGVYDGSEITEAVSYFIALSNNGIPFDVFAPNKKQKDVINHLTGEKMDEKRNVLVESARIARGHVKDLKELQESSYDAIFLPGGFGAAKNLSDFADKGEDLIVDETLADILRKFHDKKKPIALCCISPIIAAKVFGKHTGKHKLRLTLGSKGEEWPYAGAIDAAVHNGIVHKEKTVLETCFDAENMIFTTPAFMYETRDFSLIYKGINRMVESVLVETGTKMQADEYRPVPEK